MKRRLSLVLALSTGMLAIGAQSALCQTTVSSPEPEETMLQVSTHHLQFTTAGSQDIHLTSNTQWTIEVLDPWISASTSLGSGNATVTFTVAENPADSMRIGEVSISTSGIGRSVVVQQAGFETSFQLTLLGDDGAIHSSASGNTISAGETVILTPKPPEGFTFSHWSGDVSGDDLPLSVTMKDDMVVEAQFVPVIDSQVSATVVDSTKSYTLTVNTIGEGRAAAPELYVNGDTVQLTATAEKGWEFAGWTGDLVSSSKDIEVIISKDQSVTAAFERVTYSVQASSEYGSVVHYPSKSKFLEGERLTLVAEPAEGYEFVSWDGIIAKEDKVTLPVYSNIEVRAIFRKIAEVYSVSIEAEDFAAEKGTSLAKQFDGFSGEGHMVLQETGAFLEFAVYVPTGGEADLALTYLGVDNSRIHLEINGVLHSSVDLPNSGRYWNLWETSADLLQGENTVRIIRKEGDLALDYVEVSNVIPAPEVGRGASMVIYPNPATNVLNLSIPADIVITDSRGQPVIEGKNMDRINVEDLEAGLYLLSSEGQVSEVTIKD